VSSAIVVRKHVAVTSNEGIITGFDQLLEHLNAEPNAIEREQRIIEERLKSLSRAATSIFQREYKPLQVSATEFILEHKTDDKKNINVIH